MPCDGTVDVVDLRVRFCPAPKDAPAGLLLPPVAGRPSVAEKFDDCQHKGGFVVSNIR